MCWVLALETTDPLLAGTDTWDVSAAGTTTWDALVAGTITCIESGVACQKEWKGKFAPM